MQQGDQYKIPIKICMCDTIATPDNVDDVRIQVGKELREYSKDEITYNSDDKVWEFPLTEELSREIETGLISVQVAVKSGDDFIYSMTQTIPVGYSIIGEDWNV